MKKKIAIIDYGIGNLRSVQHAFQAIGMSPELIAQPALLEKYDHVVLPGVGAFDPAIKNLRSSGFADAIIKYVGEDRGKLLGLCLGMQLLFERSAEGGRQSSGLGLVKGEVKSLEEIAEDLNIPHIGWNTVRKIKNQKSRVLHDVADPIFYFVHSFYCRPEGDLQHYHTHYGQDFISAFETENIMACQFHPEKSHDAGLQVLKNFAEW